MVTIIRRVSPHVYHNKNKTLCIYFQLHVLSIELMNLFYLYECINTILKECGVKSIIFGVNFFRIDYYWLVGFYGLSTSLGLFYTNRLGKRIQCMPIFTFFVVVFKSFPHTKYKWFLNRYIWSLGRIPEGTTTLGQSGTGSNSNERVSLPS